MTDGDGSPPLPDPKSGWHGITVCPLFLPPQCHVLPACHCHHSAAQL